MIGNRCCFFFSSKDCAQHDSSNRWNQRQLADRYLTSFQESAIAWMVCDRLLQDNFPVTDPNDVTRQQHQHFFAAQTLHTKCRADVFQLPSSSLPSLRDSLFVHLGRYSMVGGNIALTNRRVVVTGLGAVSPLGITFQESWKKLLGSNDENKNCDGVTSLEEALLHQDLSPERFEREWNIARSFPCQVAAPVKGLRDVETDFNPRTTARSVQFALLAGSEAMLNADLVKWSKPNGKDNDSSGNDQHQNGVTYRFGVSVGSGMSSVRDLGCAWDTITLGGGLRKLSPYLIPKILTNSAAGRLGLEYGLRGKRREA